jgi:hypothetical protein
MTIIRILFLIFDFDPQDHLFSEDKTIEMMQYFTESSDMGKLYLNYPMVEAFYHMKSIPDKDYNDYIVSLNELHLGTYKQRVGRENRNHSYSKFAVNREECNMVIQQNIDKAWMISQTQGITDASRPILPDLIQVLKKQLLRLATEKEFSILCTCVFYIIDYNPGFITE